MPPSHAIPTTRAERTADSAITAAVRLGKLSAQSWMGVFILFGMAIWAVTLWWLAGTFTVKLDQNTQALTRCASALERMEAHFTRP